MGRQRVNSFKVELLETSKFESSEIALAFLGGTVHLGDIECLVWRDKAKTRLDGDTVYEASVWSLTVMMTEEGEHNAICMTVKMGADLSLICTRAASFVVLRGHRHSQDHHLTTSCPFVFVDFRSRASSTS